MLTAAQKALLNVIMEFLFEDLTDHDDLILAKQALESITNDKIYNENKEKFIAKSILGSIDQLRSIYQHPCPQNRSTGSDYVGQEPGYAVWKDPTTQKICREQLGLLSLTATGNDEKFPVTKKDVIDYFNQIKVAYSMKIQQITNKRMAEERQRILAKQRINIAKRLKNIEKNNQAQLATYDQQLAALSKQLINLQRPKLANYQPAYYDRVLADYHHRVTCDQLTGQYAQILHQRGELNKKMGNYPAALLNYDQALILHPNFVEALGDRAVVKHKLGQYQAALIDHDKALELAPDNIRILYNIAITYYKIGNYQTALSIYRRMIDLDANCAIAFNGRGFIRNLLNQAEIAVKDFDRAIQLNKNYLEALKNRAAVNYQLGFIEKALADWDAVIYLNSQDASAYNQRGILKNNLGLFAEAMIDYAKAISLQADYAEAYKNIGDVEFHQENYLAAISNYHEAIQLDSKYTLILGGLITKIEAAELEIRDSALNEQAADAEEKITEVTSNNTINQPSVTISAINWLTNGLNTSLSFFNRVRRTEDYTNASNQLSELDNSRFSL